MNQTAAGAGAPMIAPAHVRLMARYNAWQNWQVFESLATLDPEAAEVDRGAFWGSIRGTLVHLMWGDWVWMARFEGRPGPASGLADSADALGDLPEWAEARIALDRRILDWAETIDEAALATELRWYSGAAGREVAARTDMLVVHFFNHQTHHRGQVHAMLTQAGARAPVSDLFLMPEEGPWL